MDKINFIYQNRENFVVQDHSYLQVGLKYYFSQSCNNEVIYEGTLVNIIMPTETMNEKRYIFNDVNKYENKKLIEYIHTVSSPFIDKIYYVG